jgi:hypothetical protein
MNVQHGRYSKRSLLCVSIRECSGGRGEVAAGLKGGRLSVGDVSVGAGGADTGILFSVTSVGVENAGHGAG